MNPTRKLTAAESVELRRIMEIDLRLQNAREMPEPDSGGVIAWLAAFALIGAFAGAVGIVAWVLP